MLREIGVARRRADAEAAVRRRLDRGERQTAHVDESRRPLDVELHEVEKRRAAGDEADVGALLRGLRTCAGSDGRGGVGGADVVEVVHEACPRTRWIAATMFGYAPQRQMLPLIASFTSASAGPHGSFRSATADMI